MTAIIGAVHAPTKVGNDHTVTLSQGGQSNKALLVIYASGGNSSATSLTGATLNGQLADYIRDSGGVDGGRAAALGFAVFLDGKHPGNGAFTLTTTGITNSDKACIVYELYDVNQTTPFQNEMWSTATDETDGTSIGTTQSAQLTNLGISFIVSGDPNTPTAGLHTPTGNLTTDQAIVQGDTSFETASDAAIGSTSEAYNWTISHDGSSVVDSIITGSVAFLDTGTAGSFVVTSASDESPAPGNSVTINFSNASTPVTATYNGSALTIDSQNATSLTVIWPYPWDLSTANVDFNTAYDVVVTDNASDTSTIAITTVPASGEDYHTIDGEPWDNTSIYFNDVGLTNGDKHWGFQSIGSGMIMNTNGTFQNAQNGDQYRYRLWDTSASLWGGFANEDVVMDEFPIVSSATIDASGNTLTLVFSEDVAVGAGGTVGFSISSGESLTFDTLVDDTITYIISPVVEQTSNPTLAYVQPTDGIESLAGDDLQGFSGLSVTNNSIQGAASLPGYSTPFGIGSVTTVGGTASADLDASGNIYYVVLPDGSAEPSPAQVIAGTNASNAAALTTGSLIGGTSLYSTFSGLTANTQYDVWYVVTGVGGAPVEQDASLEEFETNTAGLFNPTYYGRSNLTTNIRTITLEAEVEVL